MKFVPESMICEFGEPIYEIVSKLTGLKFKAQIKDSGVVFKSIFKMEDLTNGEVHYLLIIDESSIRFSNSEQLISGLIIHIKKNIERLNEDYIVVNKRRNDAIVDDTYIYLENERIAFCGEKQVKLIDKLRDLRGELNLNKGKAG